jgi:peptidoglycan/LPS O-acetylase OafA/YrhL
MLRALQHAYRPPSHGSQQFPALTGIRALGAAAVFFVHLPLAIGFTLVIDVMAFFFVLSGFLIVYLYYEDADVCKGNLKKYFVNRFARIYPVYFLLVSIAIMLRQEYGTVFLLKNYTLTHALFHNKDDRAIQQSWSVTTEECFYLFAPLIMLLLRRFRFAAALAFGAILLGLALLVSQLPTSFLHTVRFIFSVTFFGHFFEFFCGIFLALRVLRDRKKGLSELRGKRFTIAGTVGILLSMAILMGTDNMNDPSRPVPFFLVNNFLLPIPIAFFYYGLIREQSRTSRVLSAPLLYLPGRSSYAFYLVHVLVIDVIATPFLAPLFGSHRNWYVLTVFVLVQLIAFFIFALYEEPLNRWIRKKFLRRAL